MASSFLKRKAEEQAKKIEERDGAGAYGSTSYLKQKAEESQKTSITESSPPTISGGAGNSKSSGLLKRKAEEQAKRVEERAGAGAYGSTSYLKQKRKEEYGQGNIEQEKYYELSSPEQGGNKDSWFKSGTFDDGYQFGDVTGATLGTVGDVGLGAIKGVGRMLEGLVDLGTYGVAGIADLLGAEEFAEKTKNVARYSATDEWTKGATDYVDKYSVLGNKADAISEGLGQVAAILATGGLAGAAGLGSAGAAAVTTGLTGLSSMGANMGEAYDNGATDGEAFVYGLSTGAIEAGTELIFGGLGKGVKALGISRGIGGLDDMFAKKLAGKVAGAFTNETVQKAVGNTIEYAVKSSGEGLEEVMSGVGSAVMKNLTYMDDKELEELIKDENLLEQFVVGTVVSSMVQSPSYIKANKAGTDFITGHTKTEESLIEDEVKREIAEREANGEKITTKVKNEIYDDVANRINQVKKTFSEEQDTLEKAARDVVANRNAAQSEIKARRGANKGTPSYEALEALTQNNEPITAADVKKVTVFGDKGAELVANLANKDGATLSQAERTVKNAYMAGFANVESNQVSFVTDTQIDAFTAGKQDRLMQDTAAQNKANNATVYKGTFTENEYTKNFTKEEKTMISTVAKSFGMDVSAVDKVIASVVNGRTYEANAEHQDGKMRISSTAEKVISELVLHEGGHRMRQLAPAEFGVLMDALYKRAEGRSLKLGVSQNLHIDSIKSEHDRAGISMETSGYMEEFAVRELETIFVSAEEFNKWYAEISGNQQVKTAWQKFMDFVTEIIEKVKTAIAQSKMTKEERAEAKKNLAELERIKELYTNAYKAAEKAVAERTSYTKSTNNLENKTNQEYNGNINHSLKSKYNEYNTIGMQWAYNSSTKVGDREVLYNPYTKRYVLVEATKEDVGFIELKTGNYSQLREDVEIYESKKQRVTDRKVHSFGNGQNDNARNNVDVGNGGAGKQNAEVSAGKPNSNETTDTQTADGNLIKEQPPKSYSLKNTSQISRRDVEDVQSIGRKSVNDFLKDDIKKAEVFARKYYQEMGEKSPFFRAWFGDWRANDNSVIAIATTKNSTRGNVINKDTGWNIQVSGKVFNETKKHNNTAANIGYHHLDNLNSIIEHAILLDSVTFDNKQKSPNSVMMHSLYALSDTGQGVELIKLYVDEIYTPNANQTIKRAYKLNGYNKIQLKTGLGLGKKAYSTLNATGSTYTVADLFNFVKQNDKDFNPKPASVVVNKDGTPKVVYHGSGENFTTFDITKSRSWTSVPDYDLPGFYFSENKEAAASYGDVKEYYINISNPYEGDLYTLAKEKGSWRNAYEYLIKENYDGVIVDEFGEGSYEYIVLKAENIKSATDNIGTFDKSNTDVSFSLKGNENIATIKKLIQSIQGRRGLRYDGGRVIRIPNNDMETLRHKFMTEHHYSNRSGGIIDCIDCFGQGGKKHYFYIFYVGEDNRVAPIFRLDYEYIERYLDDVQKISKEMGYNKDEFVNTTSGNGKGIDRIRNLAKSDSVYDVSSAGEGTNSRSGKIYNNESGRRKTDNRHNDSGISNGYNDPSNSGEIDEKARNSLKGGVSNTKLLDTIEGVQKGKQEAVDTLSKYAESGIISTELYDELIEKYGAIPKGEKPARDIDVPRKTANGKNVSQTVRTILEAKVTPDEALPSIEKMVEDGIFSYDAYTDKQAITDAEEHIKGYGWDESLDDWFADVEKGVVSKEHTAMGWALYNNAVNTSATTASETERTSAIKTSLKILDAMVRHQRSAAQALQATRILKKLSPETQLYGVQKSVSALQKELTDKYGKKAPELKISEELAEKFLNAKTEDERLAAEIELYKDIGRQMPSDWLDKWNAWRYTVMLTSLRTHGRNILGNAGFAPVVMMKNLTATAIESVVHRVSGKKMVRGKALVWGSKADKALLKAAWNDYANVADIVSGNGKYNDSAMGNKYIEEGRVIFKGLLKPVEAVRKGNSKLLELEDVWFSKPHYAYALAQYCKANNITPEQISRGKAIAPAREYAIKEAQKATYKDTNALSQMVSGWGRNGKSKNGLEKAGRAAVEGGLPFRQVPANVLVRGVEYSPLGLLKGLTYDLYKVGKGEMQAAEAIDNISAGLTGTGLLALGVYLAALGLVRGNGGDDEEKKEFEELMGHQAYALELPNGQSITLNWLAPESMPFFVGVNIWELTKGGKEDINLAVMLSAINSISDPMLEQSFLQGLNDVFESVGYAKSNDTSALYAILSTAVTSYLSQGIPTVFGQIERTGEENRMTTYTEKNAFLTDDMQYTLGKASAKIPFWDYQQIPYIDAWGRKEASGTALKRGFNNFLNPAYTSAIETSKMEEELLRLYEQTGEGGVFPSRADKYFTVDGVRKDLTADEYVRYATLKGEKSYKLVSDLVKSTAYKKLSDAEKVKAVEEAYDYANQKAKQAISNYKPDSWVNKADGFGSNVGNYISFKTEVNSTKEENGGKISKQEVADIILDMAQNDSETWKMYLSMYDSEKDKYAFNRGIGGEDYMDFITALDRYDKPTESGKYGTYTQAEATEAINNLKGLTREEKAILWQSVNTSWKKNPFR